ncbi:MAG TPA: ribonuclease HI [Anaerolineae bacterium]|nr:ribonuclease HI [Anaerolineae bacterium]
MDVIIYTDGGADPNPGIGGWAAILRFGQHEKVLTGNEPQTTNNRMELQAAIGALQALKRPSTIQFYTDSEYLRKGITEWIEGWAANNWQKKGKPVQNADLWQKLWPLVKQHQIEWHWVKGHAGNEFNERVDRLARQARLEITPPDQIDETIPRLYVRSSCKGNPGPGGWGAVLEDGEETTQSSGSAPSTTNNRMEMTAVIEGLLLLSPGSAVQVFTTSDYLYQGITQWIRKWRQRNWLKKDGKPVANADLWQALDELAQNYAIRWINAKGQALQGLEEAGKLAVEAVKIA